MPKDERSNESIAYFFFLVHGLFFFFKQQGYKAQSKQLYETYVCGWKVQKRKIFVVGELLWSIMFDIL